MNARDKRLLNILIVLIIILGLTVVLVYRVNRPQSVVAVRPPQQPASSGSAAPTPAADARIRLDWMRQQLEDGEVGRHNVFQYRERRVEPPPPPPVTAIPAQEDIFERPTDPAPVAPPPPPPPPAMTFRYEGWVVLPNGALAASLTDNNKLFVVREGEVLMGRYQVLRVSQSIVELEDLQQNRRQSFARVQ
jgi:hypothetical protein